MRVRGARCFKERKTFRPLTTEEMFPPWNFADSRFVARDPHIESKLTPPSHERSQIVH